MLDMETKFGNIIFSQNVINRIVMNALERCDGKAEIMNYKGKYKNCLLYTSPSPRDRILSRMPSSA